MQPNQFPSIGCNYPHGSPCLLGELEIQSLIGHSLLYKVMRINLAICTIENKKAGYKQFRGFCNNICEKSSV